MIRPMLLAANVGNSTVKVASVDGDGRLGPVMRFATARNADPGSLQAALAAAGVDATNVGAVAFVTVVPSYARPFAALAEASGASLLEATAATIPITARVDSPDAVGSDRLLTAWAAARLHGAPAVVVDFGTATTVNAVAADGAYVGGAIAPGLMLGLEALAARTAALPLVSPEWPSRAAARDTVEAIRSGAVIGHLGAVRELVERISRELGSGGNSPRVRLVLAGGLAEAPWWSELGRVDAVDPHLTLRGLALLHAELSAGVTR